MAVAPTPRWAATPFPCNRPRDRLPRSAGEITNAAAGVHCRARERGVWTVVARAQQPVLPVIGFLNSGSLDRYRLLLDAFRQGLKDGGYVEGQNVAIESHWAEGHSARLPELAADLVRRRVSLIAATGGSRVTTTTFPAMRSDISEFPFDDAHAALTSTGVSGDD